MMTYFSLFIVIFSGLSLHTFASNETTSPDIVRMGCEMSVGLKQYFNYNSQMEYGISQC